MICRLRARTIICGIGLLAVLGAVRMLPAASAAGGYDPSDPAQAAQYHRALTLGAEAYVYGYPLLDT